MFRQHLFAFVLSSALIAPAIAQQSTSPQAPDPPAARQPTAPPVAPSATGQPPAAGATTQAPGAVSFLAQQTADQWRADKMVGLNIYGPKNDKVGDVQEILLNKEGRAEAIVIGVGGFLGIGQKSVAVPFNAVEWKMEAARTATAPANGRTTGTAQPSETRSTASVREYPDHGVISMTKEQLEQAPSFRYASDTERRTTGSDAPANGRPAPTGRPGAPNR